jgi:release factor glutamine methyltransferase
MRTVEERLAAGGFVAADEEAAELRAAADGDPAALEALLARRLTGEPLAWITGTTVFCGLTLYVHPGVYVPRWQTEALAARAAERLPETGTAIDLCTGCGAIAAVLRERRPRARVLATDADPRAVACARGNGVDARLGDLFAPVQPDVTADVVVAVVPYVPTGELRLLQRDTLTFEDRAHYDGGSDGAALLRRVVVEAAGRLRPGGALLLELGGEQADALAPDLERHDYADVSVLAGEDGDVRGIEATLSRRRPRRRGGG